MKVLKRLYRFFIPSPIREKVWGFKSSVASRARKLCLFVFNKRLYSGEYEKPISLGRENPEKTFCVIGYENDKFSSNQGVLSTWQVFSKQIVYALQKGYVPVVDLLNNYRPMLLDSYNKGKQNAWNLYFKQPQNDFSLESVLKSKRVIFGNKGISLSRDFSWSNLPLPMSDNSMGQLLIQSSPFSDDINASVEKFVSRHFGNGDKVLGVSFRRAFERHHYFNSSLTPTGTHLVRATLESLMKRIDIKVPIEYQYLSQWTDFDSILPEGHILLNKEICGCGCTDYYLTNGQPNILVSPRRNLITSKLKNGRTAGKLFYFDRSSGTMDDTIAEMDNYLVRCNPNLFDGRSLVPKIMVTYDSLPYLKEALINRNMMDKFNLVVDEFTCIFTDVKLKGSTEINLLHELNTLPNRIVYISATPLKEAYLELLGEFKDMPYVSLKWDPSRIETANIIPRSMKSTSWAIEQIIQKYRAQGFFKSKIINGKQINSTEAVFFLNSVKDIASIIKKNELEPNETLVICADETKNRSQLRKVHHSIGTVPNEQ